GAGREEDHPGRPGDGPGVARLVPRREGEGDQREPEDDSDEAVGRADVETGAHVCLRAESLPYVGKLGPGEGRVCRGAEENVYAVAGRRGRGSADIIPWTRRRGSGRGGKRVGVCRAAGAGVGGYHSLDPTPSLGASRAPDSTVPVTARANVVSGAGREGPRGKETMMASRSVGAPAAAPDGAAGLDAILKPRTTAAVGASRSPDAIGHQIPSNLVRHGFAAGGYASNPKADSIRSTRANAR